MPDTRLILTAGSADLFMLAVLVCIWVIAMLLEWSDPASPAAGSGPVSSLAWEDPAARAAATVIPEVQGPAPAMVMMTASPARTATTAPAAKTPAPAGAADPAAPHPVVTGSEVPLDLVA